MDDSIRPEMDSQTLVSYFAESLIRSDQIRETNQACGVRKNSLGGFFGLF